MYIYLGDFYKEGYIDKDDYKKFEGLNINHKILGKGIIEKIYKCIDTYYIDIRYKSKKKHYKSDVLKDIEVKIDDEFLAKYNNIISELENKINMFLSKVELYKKGYITYLLKEDLKNNYSDIEYKFNKGLLSIINFPIIDKFKNDYKDLDQLVKEWNEFYIEKELNKNHELLSNIDGLSLDTQQRRAVVVDEENVLVIAGAGSGKTLTISAKVKYLVENKHINPDEILLISFTNKSSNEMKKRINKKLNIKAKVYTFHSLGLDIISKKLGYRKKVAEKSLLERVTNTYFKEIIYHDNDALKKLVTYFGYYVNVPKNIDSFENLADYNKYCKESDLITLKGKSQINKVNNSEIKKLRKEKKTIKGEKVKSLEEVTIANFLYLNGIEYEYEREYQFQLEDKYSKKYTPDFYLTEYDIYIEHFGINKNGRAPHLDEVEEKEYIQHMEDKINLHKEKGTILIETKSSDYIEGVLLDKLYEKLLIEGVKFKEVNCKEIYETICENKEDKYFKSLRNIINTFIKLYKSSDYKLEDFSKLSKEIAISDWKFIRERNNILLQIIKKVYIVYENVLYKNNEIDFHDMINQSAQIIKDSNDFLKYKYIIVDEYQDISASRFNLIKEIKNKTGAKLMCVGDDWQSIFRYAGSDINLFVNFDKYVGYYELLKLENTYRNSQELINIAGEFVLKNPNQIKKNLKSDKKKSNSIKIINYNGNEVSAIDKAIETIVNEYGDNAEIFLLGRYNDDKYILSKKNTNGRYDIGRDDSRPIVKSSKYPNLKMEFLTIHKSKGIEADNIIILNMKNEVIGFPNKICDDYILDLVLTKPESYIYAEERRLFYVALTRTKNVTYLISPLYGKSIFCEELIKDFNVPIEVVDCKEDDEMHQCPKCLNGNLVKRRNREEGNLFVGCTNYPLCKFTSNNLNLIGYDDIKDNIKFFDKDIQYQEHYFDLLDPYPDLKFKDIL